jgi:hypothetical protein
VPRHPDIEAVLLAWYEYEGAQPCEKDQRRCAFNALLDTHRAGTSLSRRDLIEALRDHYRACRAARDKELRSRLARLR